MEQRIQEMIDERMDRVVEQLTNRLTMIFSNQNRAQENNRLEQLVEDEDLGDEYDDEVPRQRHLQAEEFLDWLAMVEEILDFKGVLEDKRVPLVATRLRGRATAWWQQSKLTRARLEKDKIATLEKMKKHMRSAFLPYNFQRLMYQRLQNLRQGMRLMDDYTTEFYQLIARNEI
ncbi:conserved hypothetical protein [Ricinus communis]|uniref:Retrotransposon gag domain-containing protein n=1 Tax=Ricinus communis TaxID=3988 RepID=B9RL56_RICCO|nr:conserved hypothetical protein [Ricinus communis]